MNVTEIPFSETIGVTRTEKGALTLDFNEKVRNHIDTFHAAAIFSLAEAASGDVLIHRFPEFVGKVIPVMRESKIKYRNATVKAIVASPEVPDDVAEKFLERFTKTGRGLLEVDVEVKDTDGADVASASFIWYIQSQIM